MIAIYALLNSLALSLPSLLMSASVKKSLMVLCFGLTTTRFSWIGGSGQTVGRGWPFSAAAMSAAEPKPTTVAEIPAETAMVLSVFDDIFIGLYLYTPSIVVRAGFCDN